MNEGLDDEQGVIIGDLNNHSELIQFDNRIKEGTRINSNMFILASSGLDGLVQNASILGERTPIEHYDVATWQRVLHVNLTAPFILTRYCMDLLKAAGEASVIFTSSGVGRTGRAYWGAYSVSKFGIEALSQILADEHDGLGKLRFNAVNPGGTRTGMRAKAYPGEDPETLPRPEDILGVSLFLLGPASRGVNGQSLNAQ